MLKESGVEKSEQWCIWIALSLVLRRAKEL